MEKPTIADVAKYAGVSITTVSRVINNNYPVKEETRQKVEEAIQALNFKPNYLARSLIGKSTHTIGVIVPSITNLFFPVVVKGIEKVCSQKAFSLFLCDTDGKEESERIQMQNLLEKQVDGVLVIDPRYENIENGFYEKSAKKIPLVLINGYHRGIRCNFVLNDQEMGALQALEYLIKLGHRDIAFLRAKNSYSYDIKEQIYYETLQKHQIPIKEENILVIESGNGLETVELAIQAVQKRLEQKEIPTAIFACNDWMGVGVMQAAKKMGIAIPKDLSVIGYDNIVISEISEPKLTTVDQNMYSLGKASAKLLLDIIKHPTQGFQKIILDTNLIVRDSCTSPKNK